MKFIIFFITLFLLFTNIQASDIVLLAKKLKLYAGTKATIQWERVFSSKRHLKRYRLDDLDDKTRKKLKIYLIKHAADSDQPIVPGL